MTVMRFVAATGAVALPLAIAPGFLFFDDVTPKAAILLVLCAASLVLTAFAPAGWRALLGSRKGRLFLGIAVAAMGVTLLSTIFAVNRELAWYGSTWRRFGALEQIALFMVAIA